MMRRFLSSQAKRLCGIGGTLLVVLAVVAAGPASASPVSLLGSLNLPEPLDRVVADPIRNKAYGFTADGDIVFIDGATRTIENTLSTGRKFTDIDVAPDGSFVALLDNVTREYWNQPPATYLLTVSLPSQALSAPQLLNAPLFHMALGRPNRVVGVGVNQWVSVYQVNSQTGALLSSAGGGYFGSGSTDRHNVTLVASPDGTKMFRTDIGISSIDLLAFNVATDAMTSAPGRGSVGSYATEPVFINSTGSSLYVGDLRLNPNSPTNVLGVFPETIYSATGDDSLAMGRSSVYDPATGQNIGAMPVQSTYMSMGNFDRSLFAMNDNRTTLYFMSVVPEPTSGLLSVICLLTAVRRRRPALTA